MSVVEYGRVHDCVPVFPVTTGRTTVIIRDFISVDAAGAAGEIVGVLFSRWRVEIIVNIEFRWDAECAFDTFPDKLRVREDTFPSLNYPEGVGYSGTWDCGEVFVELDVCPF
jgi:hypothetical protein